ncbi:hypothetical protein ACCS93_38810 [Rhizobium ruizarguesonis]
MNTIESFPAERSYVGIHRRFSVKYLDWYMAMVAWKEDTRYMGLRWQLADVLRTVTHRATSDNLCGYWQGQSASRTRSGPRSPTRTDSSTTALLTVPPACY